MEPRITKLFLYAMTLLFVLVTDGLGALLW